MEDRRVDWRQGLLVAQEGIRVVLLDNRVGVLLILQVLADIKMEELDGDFEHLVVVEFHHHQQVLESGVAHFYPLIAIHCLL